MKISWNRWFLILTEAMALGFGGCSNGGGDAGSDVITFTETAKLVADDAQTGDEFGYSVAIDGGYVVVGAIGEDTGAANAGSVYVFEGD